MDNLEKFITGHREEFDDRVPGDEIWNTIDRQLNRKRLKRVQLYGWMWKVASMLLLAAVIGLLIDRRIHPSGEVAGNRITGNRLAEFKQVEEFYTRLIGEKQVEIQTSIKANPGLSREFSHEITWLDSAYSGLKTELSMTYSDKIVDAMIVNLQLRINILNQQLNILQAINKTKENEKAHI